MANTIQITGTGGIIEGNLGTANVNVNLDKSLMFDGTNDFIQCGTDTDWDFTDHFTLACWAKNDNATTTGGDREHLIAKYAGSSGQRIFRLYLHGSTLRFGVGYNSGNSSVEISHSMTGLAEHWNHYAASFDGGVMKLYVNGVQVVSTDNSGTLTAIHSNNAVEVNLGAYQDGSHTWTGQIADARIYNAVLDGDTEIPILASKINTDKTLGAGTTNLKGYWKLNNETASGGGSGTGFVPDDSGTVNEGALTNFPTSPAYWDYDAYSVDVYDNSTTTDGSFTVTQGKVEGKGLSSANFDGADDYIAIGNYETTLRASHTWSLWFKVTDGDAGAGQMLIGTTDASTNEAMLMNIGSSNGSLAFGYIAGSQSKDTVVSSALPDGQNPWRLYTVAVTVIDSNSVRYNMFLDGVQIGDETHTGIDLTALDLSTNIDIGAWNFGGFTHLLDYTGLIRDVRLYDYALSDEQMASLYSNTLLQTPLHHWMLDEGTGTTANDSGTSTSNGTYNGATHNNGTLDLDGTLTTAAEGTLSAPRGDLSLAAATTFAANTFVHNNGRVVVTNAGTVEYRFSSDNAGSDNPLYDFQNQAAGQVRFLTGYIIENSHTHSGGSSYNYLTSNRTYNYGTTSSAASVTTLLRSVVGTASSYANIYGVNSLFPVNISVWDDTPLYTNVAIKNVNVTTDITQFASTSNGNRTVRLDGDCEFDAVTVDSGDTLDLNAQRAEFSGNFRVESGGAMKSTGGGLIVAGADVKILGSAEGIHDGDVNMIVEGGTHDWRNGAADGAAPWCRKVLVNGNITHEDQLGGSSGNHNYNPESVTVGNGKLTQSGGHAYLKDLTIATAGNLEMTQSTQKDLDINGDFNIAGGLIGLSALSFPDGGDSPSGAGNALDVPYDLSNLTGDATIEFWMYADANTNANSRGVINGYRAGFDNRWQLYHTTSNNLTFYSHPNNKSITVTCPTGKWSHVAIVCTGVGGDVKLYIDGKLKGQTELGSGVSLATPGAFPDFGVNRQDGSTDIRTGQSIFEGELAMLRIWTDERTESELRANMFATYANLASNTDCAIAYEFDEGTSTDVDDKVGSNNGTLVNSVTWAGNGTYTMSTSTVDFTGNGQWAISDTTTDYYNVKVAASGKTTTINSVGSSERRPRITNLLTHGGGTLTDINNADITFYGTGTHTAGADLSGLYITYYPSSTDIPGGTYQFLITQHNDLVTAGDITCTGYFAISTGDGFDLKDQTLTTPRFINYANSTFNMDAGNIVFTSANGLTGDYDGRTFTAGPGATITGIGAKSGFFSENNYEVVGDITNLDVTNEELTVAGKVTNCTGDIIQWHHSQDYDQKLDADTADDRDIKLGGPALDNANALNT